MGSNFLFGLEYMLTLTAAWVLNLPTRPWLGTSINFVAIPSSYVILRRADQVPEAILNLVL